MTSSATRPWGAGMDAIERMLSAVPPLARRIVIEILAVGAPAVAALWAVPPHPWSLPAALVGCALLPLRHIRPELAVIGVLPALAGGLGWPAAGVALYALGRRNRRSVAIVPWTALVVAVVFGSVMVYESLSWQRLALTFTLTALISGAPALLGMLMSTRERLTASLTELRHAREEVVAATREAARTQERARISREIHDSVGHHSTLIAVSAAALASSTTDPPTRDAAEQIRALAKSSLAEMRTALGLIDEPGHRPGGGVEVAALVAGARAAGVAVDVVHDGAPVELGHAVDRAVYRVVQESLTNAVRHAPGAPVQVHFSWHQPQVRVEISNPVTVPPGPQPAPTDGGGRGLTGLAERVRLVGGHVEARPTDPSTFTVTATFPQVPTPGTSNAPPRPGAGQQTRPA